MQDSARSEAPRRRRRLAVVLGLLTALAVPATAGATTPDPVTTNIPYVAWRGEQVRVVKCDPSLAEASSVEAFVEEWSNARDPQIEQDTVRLFTGSDERSCASFDVTSLQDGLARIKLVATDEAGRPVLKHQFLAIWLSLGTPTIHEVAATDPTGGPVGSDAEVGDPLGDGALTAGSADGRVQVTVKGSFPHPLGPGGRFTLPDDWAALADALATDAIVSPAPDTMRWDIHDDQGKGDKHVAGFCAGNGAATDDVDNCQGGGDTGPFSNTFGDGMIATGPFDPIRRSTVLSNGVLDAGDAPMPAARIDIAIAPNTGAAGDISGAGALRKADKSDVYSRDGNGTPSPHNLYAPFYQQYIPATSSDGETASGVDGPAAGNNFPGFLVDGRYDNWDTIPLSGTARVETTCNRFVDFTGDAIPAEPEPRVQPYGDQTVAVYTDEHGEAQVAYQPYASGFYYDSLPVVHNANGGCDLQGIPTLGTASISATARYPYQPVSDTPKVSGTLTKTVANLFDKSLSYWPKGAGAENNNARIVVVHANDVDGSPFAYERVCFYVGEEADGVRAFNGTVTDGQRTLTVGGTGLVFRPEGADVCRRTDGNGNAAIEVMNSDPQTINVIAEFLDEGLLRSIDVAFSPEGSNGGALPGGGEPVVTVRGGAQPGTTAPSEAQVARTAGPAAAAQLTKAAAKKKAKVRRRITTTRVIRLRTGKRALLVRVSSTRRTEKIRIRVGKRRAVVRTVKTGRLVRVSQLSVPAGARTTVALMG